ncbi:LytR/AlgR family response regulator transcription factor [Vibrio sonorensis]|uniref:LytR/AlgR family response regulator transcription factor n=1 Tax=Vibrio sonorensis TaxID=1004316 RepID=UPI000A7B744F|nr:LytTR family DNA-binding domain-containing protein [Vibrio sonorensis]
MKRVTAIIADDEPLLRHHLNKQLADAWPELEVVGLAGNGGQALAMITCEEPDIAFLDIRMPELDGMSLATELQKLPNPPLIVFITAFDEYAVKAFENNAIDYLLKPLSDKRLDACIAKIKSRLDQTEENTDLGKLLETLNQVNSSKAPEYLKWIRVSKGDDILLVSVDDVLYFKAEDKYVSLFKSGIHGKEEFLLRTSLKDLMTQLDPEQFWQIHRSTLVNVSAISKVKKELTGKMSLIIGEEKLPISRAMQSKFNHHW